MGSNLVAACLAQNCTGRDDSVFCCLDCFLKMQLYAALRLKSVAKEVGVVESDGIFEDSCLEEVRP